MNYLASVTQEEGRIEKQLLEAHPILEGFYYLINLCLIFAQRLEMQGQSKTITAVVSYVYV